MSQVSSSDYQDLEEEPSGIKTTGALKQEMQRPIIDVLSEGNVNPAAWFRRYELYVELYVHRGDEKVEELPKVLSSLNAKYLPFYLSGRVLATYEQLSDADKLSYEVVKGKLLTAYRMNGATAYGRFTSSSFGGGSVDMHIAELRGLLDLIPGMSAMTPQDRDGLVLEQFLRGLPPSISRELRLVCVDPTTGQVALEKVLERARLLPELAQGFADNPREMGVPPVIGAVPKKKLGPRCFGCGKVGHIRRDCQEVCFKCNEKGHRAKDCSQEGKAEHPNAPGGLTKGTAGPLQQGSPYSKSH